MFKQPLIIFFIFSINLTIAQKNTENKAELYAPVYSFYYPPDKWELKTENANFLDLHVFQMIEKSDIPNIIIYIDGHTDDIGNSDYNMMLSQKRAQAVADYLISKGFAINQIKVSYFGESKPEMRKIAISNKMKDIRYANRRVVIRIEKL